jgi:hypothetical protein
VNFDHIIKYLTDSVSKTTFGFLLCISAPLAMGIVFAKINRKPPNWREGGMRGRLLAQYAGLTYLILAVYGETDFSALEKLGLIGLFAPIWIIICYMVFEVAILFQERMRHVSDEIEFDYKTAILNIMTNSWLLLIRPLVLVVSWFSSGYTKSNSHPPTKSQQKP